ncbi:reverse transcriptase domain-containing protein [Trichonephila clavipes]|nr:reverse transcriptase domain-containing protein [Trichonephila clavipes]
MIPAFEAGTNPSESWRHWKEDLEALRYRVKRQRKQKLLYSVIHAEKNLKNSYERLTLSLTMVVRFLEIKQEQGEKFTDYYSRHRNAVVECNYGESQDRMLWDKLIQGLLDKALQERLIRETSKKARAPQEVVSESKTAENSRYKHQS